MGTPPRKDAAGKEESVQNPKQKVYPITKHDSAIANILKTSFPYVDRGRKREREK